MHDKNLLLFWHNGIGKCRDYNKLAQGVLRVHKMDHKMDVNLHTHTYISL